ncbi:MAG: hypothetical protein ACR2J4_03420 [Deinococcus sp.]
MRVLAFCALDGLLFADAVGAGREADRALASLRRELLGGAVLVPVGSRGRLPSPAFLHPPESWAILDHGGTVLRPGGEPDQVWSLVMRETLEGQGELLRLAAQAAGHISDLMNLGCTVTLREVQGLPLLVEVRHPHDLRHSLNTLAQEWRLWREETGLEGRFLGDDKQLTLIGRGVSKEAAVEYVLEQLRQEAEGEGETLLTLALGNGPGDAPFMGLCDFALTPGDSPLMQKMLESPPGGAVTSF